MHGRARLKLPASRLLQVRSNVLAWSGNVALASRLPGVKVVFLSVNTGCICVAALCWARGIESASSSFPNNDPVAASRFKHSLCITQVKGFARRAASPSPLNDSPEGDIQAFLTEEDRLHTCDDLTKVNPVTPTTGTAAGDRVGRCRG